MAISKCPKYDCTRFELKEANISGSAFQQCFIQCDSCGAVVGVIPSTNTEFLIRRLAERLRIRL